eukprot:9510462-Alexandrium_andersonii.AAC.1
MPLAVMSTLCPAHPEVLSAIERSEHNHGRLPAACVIVVLNQTAARIVIAAARSGLLSQFQHPGCRVDARCLGPVEQSRYVGMCTALRELLDMKQSRREA